VDLPHGRFFHGKNFIGQSFHFLLKKMQRFLAGVCPYGKRI
jgi:hypothetical protein